MRLPPLEKEDLIHLMPIIKTVSHADKFSIFSTKTVKIAHFTTRFFDYFDHYTSNY